MAMAAKTTITETKVVEAPGVEMVLTVPEAEFLVDILDRVGGHPRTRRGLADAIRHALYAVGVRSSGLGDVDLTMGAPGSIYLK